MVLDAARRTLHLYVDKDAAEARRGASPPVQRIAHASTPHALAAPRTRHLYAPSTFRTRYKPTALRVYVRSLLG
eukprot:3607449-Pleurochrysis_carterae.AAC.1